MARLHELAVSNEWHHAGSPSTVVTPDLTSQFNIEIDAERYLHFLGMQGIPKEATNPLTIRFQHNHIDPPKEEAGFGHEVTYGIFIEGLETFPKENLRKRFQMILLDVPTINQATDSQILLHDNSFASESPAHGHNLSVVLVHESLHFREFIHRISAKNEPRTIASWFSSKAENIMDELMPQVAQQKQNLKSRLYRLEEESKIRRDVAELFGRSAGLEKLVSLKSC
jgi:hypothetical protein